MKLLFVHGTKIKEDKNGDLYTGGSYNQEAWDRYLSITDDFSVCARKEKKIYEVIDAENKFNYFDTDKVKFIETPDNVSSILDYISVSKYNDLNNIIGNQVSKSDYVIARLPSSNGNLAIKYAKKFNKPYLIEVVGCAFDSLWNNSWKGRILAFSKYKAMQKSIIDAPYVVYVTKQFLQDRYPTNGKNINCSDVSLEEFDEEVLNNRLNRIKSMQGNGRIIIGTIAAVNVSYKGQQFIIQALGKLKKTGITNFEYQLVGDGNQKYLKSLALKHSVEGQVKFLGSIPHNEIFNWLDNIDVYAQPSLTEGLPRALIEAMSRGLPSIGSNAGGIPELISSDFIFKSKDVNDLAKRLIKILNGNMLKEARRNFNKSKEFESSVLNKKRNEFYLNYKNSL